MPRRNLSAVVINILSRTLENSSGCLEFQGARNRFGYGVVKVGKKTAQAHRVILAEKLKIALSDLDPVLHSCDNPSCVNENHLRVGSYLENNREAFIKGRQLRPVRTGEHHHLCKLSDDSLDSIRKMGARFRRDAVTGKMPHGSLVGIALKYKTSVSLVSSVLSGKYRTRGSIVFGKTLCLKPQRKEP